MQEAGLGLMLAASCNLPAGVLFCRLPAACCQLAFNIGHPLERLISASRAVPAWPGLFSAGGGGGRTKIVRAVGSDLRRGREPKRAKPSLP